LCGEGWKEHVIYLLQLDVRFVCFDPIVVGWGEGSVVGNSEDALSY
jgi:hypothetical protein